MLRRPTQARRRLERSRAALWRRLLPRLGRRGNALLLRVARALRVEDRAVRAHLDAAVTQRVQAFVRDGRVDDALRVAERAARDASDRIVPRDLWIATLDHAGQADRALPLCIENAERQVERLARREEEAAAAADHGPASRVFITGYFYSGSGAVLDYLLGVDGAVKWTPAGEMRLIKFPGGYADLVKRHAAAGELTAQDLVDHYLHVSGQKLTLRPRGTYDQWAIINRSGRRLARTPEAAGYLRSCYEAFLDLATDTPPDLDAAELEGRIRTYVGRALDAAARGTGARCLLVDQAITAWRLDVAHLAPPSTFVIVHRDPRDQYAEAKAVLSRPGRKMPTPAQFAKQYRRRRRKVDEAARHMEEDLGHQVIRLGFEDFLHDHESQARKLLETLGREDDYDPTRTSFDVAVSRRNIGKYPDHLDRDEVAVLEDELPEYLSPYVTRSARDGRHRQSRSNAAGHRTPTSGEVPGVDDGGDGSLAPTLRHAPSGREGATVIRRQREPERGQEPGVEVGEVLDRLEELERRADRLQRSLSFQLEKVRVVSRRVGERADRLERGLQAHFHQVEGILGLYHDLQPRRSLPPTRGFAVSPDLLLFLYHMVLERRPRRVLELGSGVSTLIMAYALEAVGADGHIVSLEHDDGFRATTEATLEEHELAHRADVRFAPLEPVDLGGQTWQWYARQAVPDDAVDLLFVDGPPGNTQDGARYPAVPLLHDRLAPEAVVVVDDLIREDEQEMVERWLGEHPDLVLERHRHEKVTGVLRRARSGHQA